MKIALYSGAGNLFFLVDNRKLVFDKRDIPLSEEIDGVIFVNPATNADVSMRTFNRDGSEAEMCGNGLRCLIAFLRELGIERSVYTIDTLAGQHKGWYTDDTVCVQLPSPTHLKLHILTNECVLHFLNTGVPHAVIFVPSVEEIDVIKEGRKWRHSTLFAPAGANINFVSIEDQTLYIRTYERGVEAETLACGTGVTAAALIAHKLYSFPSPIQVHVQSGDLLKVSFNPLWSEVTLQGPAKKIRDISTDKESTIKDQKSIMAGV